MIDPSLLAILACPRCADRPSLEAVDGALRCPGCGAVYPVVEGIPHLLPEDAVFADQAPTQRSDPA